MPTLVIDITPAGNVNIDAQGFEDNTCAKATEQIEVVLGGVKKKDEKPEFFCPASSNQNTKLTF